MKLYNLIIAFVCLLFIVSCGNEYDTEEYFDLEELPGYVAFDADGNTVNVPSPDLDENGGTAVVTVEHPTELLSDATVTYSLGGTAVFGEDYTIEGATASGGSVTIPASRGDVALTYQADIELEAIDDEIYEGNKTIILTLTGASNSEGEIALGRGGKEFQREATVNLIDDECESEYAGSYLVSTTYMMLDTNIVDTVFTVDSVAAMIMKKAGEYFTYTIDEASGGLYTSEGLYGMNLGTTGLPLEFVEDCGAIDFGGSTDELGRVISNGGSGVNSEGVITISIETLEMITMDSSIVTDKWVSTYTPN